MPGAVTIFISARVDELERRLRERATESSGEIDERIELARKQLEQAGEFDHVIENDDLERAVGELTTLVRGLLSSRSYHAAAMIEPRVDDLLENVDSRYALVIVAAKRARQINNYHHQLGEGTFGDNLPPLVESRSKNYLTMALEEVSDGMLEVRLREVGRHHAGMSRVLLGVTGGIAAYKACELCRLLVKEGHEVVPLVTPGAERFVTAETFRALARRPPGDDVYLHLDARRPARRRALHGEHAGQARARARRQRPHRGGARAPRAGARRAGDEPADVGASGDAGERRGAARARRRARRAGRGRDGRGRARRGADGRAGRDPPRGDLASLLAW